jgi:hypothetical protein
VSDEVLAGQVDNYRRRAGEYDATAYGDVAAARARIARLVAEMRPAGSVLEIACGTGLWTEALAGWADTVTAMDAAPEYSRPPELPANHCLPATSEDRRSHAAFAGSYKPDPISP